MRGLAAAYIAGIVTRPGRTIIILNARKLLSATERLALGPPSGAAEMSDHGSRISGASSRRSTAASTLRRPAAEREAVKRDIIALFKRVDGALAELGQLKEDIRGLVDRYKQAEQSPPRPVTGPRPVQRRPSRRSMPTTWAPPPSSRRAGA